MGSAVGRGSLAAGQPCEATRAGLAGLELSLLCREGGKGLAGSGQSGTASFESGYGRENTVRRVLAAAWPWGYGNLPHQQ